MFTKVFLPRFITLPDKPHWLGSPLGNFSPPKAAYDIITTGESPQKLKGFLWLVMHGRLLTNQLRVIRGLDLIDDCPRCNTLVENMSHLFRDCFYSKELWTKSKVISCIRMALINLWETGSFLTFVINLNIAMVLIGLLGSLSLLANLES